MAVPVDGIRIIFESILKCFAGEEYTIMSPSFDPLLKEEHVDLYNSCQRPEQLYAFECEKEYAVL